MRRALCLFVLVVGSLVIAGRSRAFSPPARKDNDSPKSQVAKLVAVAQTHADKNEWDAVISTCTEALKLQPGNFDALSERALAYSQTGKIDEAFADYESALKIKPDSPVELTLRSGLYLKKRRFDLAMRDLSNAIRIDPKFTIAYQMRGDLRLSMQNYSAAIADYTESIKQDPTVVQVYFNRARALQKDAGTNSGPGAPSAADQYRIAVRDYQQAINLDPKSAEALSALAWLQATCPEAAIRDGKAAVTNALAACELTAYKNSEYLDTLAAAYAAAGDFDNAVTWTYGAIDLAPAAKKPAMQERVKLYEKHQPYREKANPPPPDAGPAPASAWQPLFNGRDLDGWEHVGPGRFVVEDGMLKTEGGMGLLWYKPRKFGNCVLRVIYRTTTPVDNSGVYVRIADAPSDPRFAIHHGYEVQIYNAGDNMPYQETGSVYSFTRADAHPAKGIGQWETMEITLDGNRIVTSLNGVRVADFDPTQPAPKVGKRGPGGEPDDGPRPAIGYIGLQNHGAKSVVYFKEVSVRPLR